MKQIIDPSGRVIEGLFRDENGAISVSDKKSLNEFTRQKNMSNKIENLEKNVVSLNEKLDTLLGLIKDTLNKP